MSTGAHRISSGNSLGPGGLQMLVVAPFLALMAAFVFQGAWLPAFMAFAAAMAIFGFWWSVHRSAAEVFVDDERRVIEARRRGETIVVPYDAVTSVRPLEGSRGAALKIVYRREDGSEGKIVFGPCRKQFGIFTPAMKADYFVSSRTVEEQVRRGPVYTLRFGADGKIVGCVREGAVV